MDVKSKFYKIKDKLTPINLTNAFGTKTITPKSILGKAATVMGGLTLVGLEGVSDLYANQDWLRDGISTALEYLPGNSPADNVVGNGIEQAVRDYLTLGGIQNHLLYSVPAGTFTDSLAYSGAILAAAAGVLLYRDLKKANPSDKPQREDYIKLIKDYKLSAALAGAGIINVVATTAVTIGNGLTGIVGATLYEDSKISGNDITTEKSVVNTTDQPTKSTIGEIADGLEKVYGKVLGGFGYKAKGPVGANDLAPEVSAYSGITHNAGLSKGNKAIREVEAARVPVDTVYTKSFEPAKRQNSKATDNASYLWKNNASEMNKQLENMGFFR